MSKHRKENENLFPIPFGKIREAFREFREDWFFASELADASLRELDFWGRKK